MTATPDRLPADDEVLVHEGKLFDFGRNLIEDHLGYHRKRGAAFKITQLHVSFSKTFSVIVRASVVWTIDGDVGNAFEMVWRDCTGRPGSRGEVID